MLSLNALSSSNETGLKYTREETVDLEFNEETLPQVDAAEYAEMNMLTILFVQLCGNIFTIILVTLPAVIDVGSSHLYSEYEYVFMYGV